MHTVHISVQILISKININKPPPLKREEICFLLSMGYVDNLSIMKFSGLFMVRKQRNTIRLFIYLLLFVCLFVVIIYFGLIMTLSSSSKRIEEEDSESMEVISGISRLLYWNSKSLQSYLQFFTVANANPETDQWQKLKIKVPFNHHKELKTLKLKILIGKLRLF